MQGLMLRLLVAAVCFAVGYGIIYPKYCDMIQDALESFQDVDLAAR